MEVLASTGAGTFLNVTTKHWRHTCIVTICITGRVVTASSKGEIRMFNHLDKRAKTLLPGLGGTVFEFHCLCNISHCCCKAAIIALDVTKDGKWIVATTSTYLLVIDTQISGDPNGRTGFEVDHRHVHCR